SGQTARASLASRTRSCSSGSSKAWYTASRGCLSRAGAAASAAEAELPLLVRRETAADLHWEAGELQLGGDPQAVDPGDDAVVLIDDERQDATPADGALQLLPLAFVQGPQQAWEQDGEGPPALVVAAAQQADEARARDFPDDPIAQVFNSDEFR